MRVLLAAFALLALAACQPRDQSSAEQDDLAALQANGISVTAPAPRARLTSPIRVEGTAQNDWYFEAVFDVRLVGADGATLDEAPAQAQSDWTVPGPVPFIADLTFDVAAETNAVIVLREDTTGEKPEIRSVRIPVVLAP